MVVENFHDLAGVLAVAESGWPETLCEKGRRVLEHGLLWETYGTAPRELDWSSDLEGDL